MPFKDPNKRKEWQRQYQREYYRCHKEHIRAKASFYTARKVRKIKAELVAKLGGRCSHCGYNRCLNALVFHHKDPNKKMKSEGGFVQRYLDGGEIDLSNIQLLCANCHAEVHAEDEIKGLNYKPITNYPRNFPLEVRKKISHTLKGRKTWNKGRPLPYEQRLKMGETRRRLIQEGKLIWSGKAWVKSKI
jgi:5-methylcytosine-specific restriction endonuclease McrA